MAQVNRAEMQGLAGFRKQVALKRLHPHVAGDPSMVQAFVHEARLASHLRHPNVAQVYDLGMEDGTYFIAMEYIPGPTLVQLLRQSTSAAGPVPIPIALAILGQICDALDYAHNLCDDKGRPLGIIHRDVSPSNIIVSNTGVVKLIDFGIAKAAGSDKTQTGLIKGKFAYMAPEYIRGQLDLRADLFGLGVIAHELLTGRRLFQAKNDFDTIVRLREMPIQPPSRWSPDVTRDVDDIVLTALQRDPELRWQSAAAMRTAIGNATQALGGTVTNQQVLEWVEWAFEQQPRKEDTALVRVIDALAEPTGEGVELSLAQAAELVSMPGPPAIEQDDRRVGRVGRVEAEVRTRPAKRTAKVAPRRLGAGEPPGARRAWSLLLVLIVLAVLARDQLVLAGRALHAWAVG